MERDNREVTEISIWVFLWAWNHIRCKYLLFWDHHRDQSLLHPWRSSGSDSHWHHICCMCCCWMCSQPKRKENHSLSEEVQSAESLTIVDKVKWAALCNTLTRGTLPFRRVAAVSYSGASRLQWPHLMDRRYDQSNTGTIYTSAVVRFQLGQDPEGGLVISPIGIWYFWRNSVGFVKKFSLRATNLETANYLTLISADNSISCLGHKFWHNNTKCPSHLPKARVGILILFILSVQQSKAETYSL